MSIDLVIFILLYLNIMAMFHGIITTDNVYLGAYLLQCVSVISTFLIQEWIFYYPYMVAMDTNKLQNYAFSRRAICPQIQLGRWNVCFPCL